MFTYCLAPSAAKDARRLPKRFQIQILGAIEDTCRLPHPLRSPHVIKLEGYSTPTYRLRSGDYRIVFYIIGNTLMIDEIKNRQAGY